MRPLRDPEGAELKHLIGACDLAGKRVVEIGSGDGRFIRQYNGLIRCVVGIDPVFDDLHEAVKTINNSNSHFIQAEGEQLPFPDSIFDIALFASSL